MANETLPLLSVQNPGVAVQAGDIFLARQVGAATTTMDSAPTAAQIKAYANASPSVTGGISYPSRAVTALTTTTTADYTVFCNGTFTVTLHTPTTGQVLNLKNTGAGAITISGTTDLAGSTIAAGVSYQLQYDLTGATWRAI